MAMFFVSYTVTDQPWAEWIAWQLEAAGYTTELQAWDFLPGSDFVHEMQQAVQRADRTIAVLSPAYFGSRFGEAEWRAAFAKDPAGTRGLLVPVRVWACDPPGLLLTRIYVDLVGLDEAAARERLLAGVQQQRGRPQIAPAFPGAAAAPAFPGGNLAPRNPNFTGRENLLDALAQSLAAGTMAVVAVHGLGGVGKSHLALEYAHQHAADYDLVWWVAAETPSFAAARLAELAPRLGLSEQHEQAEQVAAVLAELARRDRWLLVFDNAERPQDLTDCLPRAGGGQVLITSRNPAWGRLATSLPVDAFDQADAAAFLMRRTGDADQTAAAALAQELGGLPLALEQAAAYCERTPLPLAGYLKRYRRHHTRLLATGAPEDYPATVATTWRLNIEQASQTSPAATALLRLAAFLAAEAIPLTLLVADSAVLPDELAAAATDELALDEAVGALYRYSLIGRDQAGLRVHRLVQAVVINDLAPMDQAAWITQAVRLLDAALPVGTAPDSWSRWVELLPHVLAVAKRAEKAQVALQGSARLLERVSGYEAARAEFEDANSLQERAQLMLAPPKDLEVATGLTRVGLVVNEFGDLVRARNRYEDDLTFTMTHYGPGHPSTGKILGNLGVVLHALGDFHEARRLLERALAIKRAAHGSQHPEVARTLADLALVLYEIRHFATADEHLEQALAIFEAAYGAEHAETAATLSNLGLKPSELGLVWEDRLERALALFEDIHGPQSPEVAATLRNYSLTSLKNWVKVGAEERLERALAIFEANYGPQHPEVADTLRHLAMGYPFRHDPSEARKLLERALGIFRAICGSEHPEVAKTLICLSDVHLHLSEIPHAKKCLEEAIAIYRTVLGEELDDSIGLEHPPLKDHFRSYDLSTWTGLISYRLDKLRAYNDE